MSERLTLLIAHREHLIKQSAVQRNSLTHSMEGLRAPLAMADQAVAAVRFVGRRPALLVGAALFVIVLRPERMGRWLGRIWILWQIGRRLRND